MTDRAVRQNVDKPRHTAIDAAPIVDGRPRQTGLEGDRGDVQQQVRRAAAGRVNGHRVLERVVCQNVASRDLARLSVTTARAAWRAAASQIGCPEGASAVCGSDMPSASATTCEVGGRAEETGSLRRRSARAATHVGGVFAADVPFGEADADGLHLAGIFRIVAGSVTPPGTITVGKSCCAASAIIIAGNPLSQVAMPMTPCRKGSDRMSP